MRITGADVYGEDRKFHEKVLYINKDGKIAEEDPGDDITVSANGCYAIPGLVDIHFHGAVGHDFCDGTLEAFERIAEYEVQNGITTICPALLTLPVEKLKKVLSVGADYSEIAHPLSAELAGFNMEGPFISRVKKGAQNENYIIGCNDELVDEFILASKGLLKIIGLAPEENPGFENYINKVKDKVKVSLAHTNADYATVKRAFDVGASHVVHLFNAMPSFGHREPGVVGAVFDDEKATAEIICDGIHLHGSAVRLAFKMLGPDRTVMISDSLRCTGMPDGKYELGGLDTEKKGRECRLVEGGSIAGSVSNLFECMRVAVLEMGIPLEDAVAAATINPAGVIGASDRCGSLNIGKNADILLVDKQDLTLREVYKRGQKIKIHQEKQL